MKLEDVGGWGVRDVVALVQEIERDLSQRERDYPERIRKGRMNQRNADARLAIIRDIRGDLLFSFAPLGDGEIRIDRLDPAIAWRSKVRWINAELEELRQDAEERIKKGRADRRELERSIGALEQLRRLYWERLFMWEPEPGSQAAAYLDAIRKLHPNASERRAELWAGELGRAYRQTIREHVAAVELERDPARQMELVA